MAQLGSMLQGEPVLLLPGLPYLQDPLLCYDPKTTVCLKKKPLPSGGGGGARL